MQTPSSSPKPRRPADIILDHLGAPDGSKVLDIGCGRGGFARMLSERGFDVIGVDPADVALTVARKTAPKATFEQAFAEKLPFPDASAQAVIFFNSLHHVPPPAMADALSEAARVMRADAIAVIVEPVARGGHFESMRPIEDETEVRAEAAAAIREALSRGLFVQRQKHEIDLEELFPDLDAFLAAVVSVDAARGPKVDQHRATIEALFERHAEKLPDGYRFLQPLQIYVLEKP